MKKTLSFAVAILLFLASFGGTGTALAQPAEQMQVGPPTSSQVVQLTPQQEQAQRFWAQFQGQNFQVIDPYGVLAKTVRQDALWTPPGSDPTKTKTSYFFWAMAGNTIYAANGVDMWNGYGFQITYLVTGSNPNGQQVWTALLDNTGNIPSSRFNAKLTATSDHLTVLSTTFVLGLPPQSIAMPLLSMPVVPITTGTMAVAVTLEPNGQPGVQVAAAFVHYSNGVVDGRAAVLPVDPVTAWTMAFDRDGSEETGLSLSNPDPSVTANCQVTILDGNGYVIGNGHVDVLPLNQTSRYVHQLVSLPPGPLQGSMSWICNAPVVPVAMQNSGFNFSTGIIAAARQGSL